MYAARAADTVGMTKDRNLAVSTLLAVPEVGRAAIDNLTGGVFVGERTGKVISDFRDRAALLDGNKVLSSISGMPEQYKDTAGNNVDVWFAMTVQDMGIDSNYMTVEGQIDYLQSQSFGRFAEGLRKMVGPDAAFAEKLGPAWKILTSGSERKAVDQIQENLRDRMATVESASTHVGEQFVKNAGAEQNLSEAQMTKAVEVATLVALKDAQQGFATEELTQVKRRQQLDKAWMSVGKIGSFASAAAVVGMASGVLQGPVANLENYARVALQGATERLSEVQAGAAKIIEIAKANGMGGSELGANMDVFFSNLGVKFMEASVGTTDKVGNFMVDAKVIGPMLAKLTLFAGAMRGAFEGVPLRSKVRTALFQSTNVK
jgi:hypothetical protein